METNRTNETGAGERSSQTGVLYFPISPLKLVVLSIVTFGFYEIFWFYMHWWIYRNRTGANITAAARALFALFFCYPLFRRIRDTAVGYGVDRTFSPGLLAAGWIILSLSSRLPGPIWLITLLSPFVLAPVQITVNELNKKVAPAHDPNEGFTGWNIAGIVLGGLLLLITVVGSFVPEPPR
jgi:hypothetical protein